MHNVVHPLGQGRGDWPDDGARGQLVHQQVASELKLATRTVHDYVAMLYQHFQVSSRAELLAYFIRRRPVARPRELNGSR
jgi:hypothetical protein